MKCPKCGSTKLKVEVSFAGQVVCNFDESENFELIDDLALDSSLNEDSLCECIECHWVGKLTNAKSGQAIPLDAGERLSGLQTYRGPISSEELWELEQLLDSQRCPPLWREKIERLIAEVKRLNAFLDTITRITDQAAARGDSSNNDTVVG